MALDLPTPGADLGTWGTKLNNALNGTGPGTLSATIAAQAVPKWQPTTAYAAGERVVNPSGDIVLAKVAFTSGAVYDPANWNPAGAVDNISALAYQRPPTPPTRANVKTMFGAHYVGHGWTAGGLGIASSEMNDTTDFLLGTQSARITATTDGVDANFKRVGLTADFTDCDVRLYFKYSDFADLAKVSVFLYTDASNYKSAVNVLDLTAGTEPPTMAKAGVWTTLDIPYSRFTSGGGAAFNRASVTEIRVYFNSKSGRSAIMRLGGVAAVYQNELGDWPNGVLTISMDDCWAGQATLAIPYLDRFGDRATFFPIANFTDVNRFPTSRLAQLRDQGHEIGAHAGSLAIHGTGWNALTEAQLVDELEALRQWQLDNGYPSPSLAYPLGNWTPTVALVTSRYYESARLAEGGFHENARPVNPHALRCYDAGTLSQAVIKAEMDRAKASRGWLILMYHQIVASGATGNQATVAEFQEIVDYAHTLGMPLRTQGEVIKAAQG